MVKPEQILIIEPQSELRFRGPFTDAAVTSYIKLTNPTKHSVYYKIKTTAPKRYCVRPNAGLINPKQVTSIAVTYQPSVFYPPEKSKHKFMVQALIAPSDEDDQTDVWRDPNPDEIMESKLKCVFEIPFASTDDDNTAATASNTTTTKTEVTTNNGKNKGVGDSVKSSPMVLGETEEKLIKAAKEVNLLRVEESTLRQENLQLKEDLLKYKQNAVLNREATLAAARGVTSESSSELPITSTTVLVAVGAAMIIIGYLLGKMSDHYFSA